MKCTMTFKVTRIIAPKYTDCSISDCFPDGFYTPGYAVLHTTEETPVECLPSSECKQYGHETASGLLKLSLRSLKSILKRPPKKGDIVSLEVEMCRIRNKVARKTGNFRCYYNNFSLP